MSTRRTSRISSRDIIIIRIHGVLWNLCVFHTRNASSIRLHSLPKGEVPISDFHFPTKASLWCDGSAFRFLFTREEKKHSRKRVQPKNEKVARVRVGWHGMRAGEPPGIIIPFLLLVRLNSEWKKLRERAMKGKD